MRYLRTILLPVAIAALVAACTPSTSSQDGTEPSTAASASEGSQPSQGGQPSDAGGGGGGGGANGSVQYEISGDYTDSGELRFVPEASYFEQNGVTYLSFTNEGSSTVLFLTLGDAGNASNFGNGEASIASTPENCNFNLTRNDATGASGTFDCPGSFAVLAGGTQTGTATIKGTFEARK
jgi:hypothetical protein